MDDLENYVVVPKSVDGIPKATMWFDLVVAHAKEAYNKLIALGVKKEDARFVLPNACMSRIAVTANFREWRHILRERTSKHAQWEIRDAMLDAAILLYGIAPSCFKEYV